MNVSDSPSADGFSDAGPSYNTHSSVAYRQEKPSLEDIPLELLLEIFTHFEATESWHPFFGCIRRSGLAKLMLVCKERHSIISATADFWRVVDTTDSLELISLCLRRSRGSLIDVLVSLLRETEVELFPDQIQGLGGDAISLLVPHAARVRSLFIDTSPDDFFLVEPLFED